MGSSVTNKQPNTTHRNQDNANRTEDKSRARRKKTSSKKSGTTARSSNTGRSRNTDNGRTAEDLPSDTASAGSHSDRTQVNGSTKEGTISVGQENVDYKSSWEAGGKINRKRTITQFLDADPHRIGSYSDRTLIAYAKEGQENLITGAKHENSFEAATGWFKYEEQVFAEDQKHGWLARPLKALEGNINFPLGGSQIARMGGARDDIYGEGRLSFFRGSHNIEGSIAGLKGNAELRLPIVEIDHATTVNQPNDDCDCGRITVATSFKFDPHLRVGLKAGHKRKDSKTGKTKASTDVKGTGYIDLGESKVSIRAEYDRGPGEAIDVDQTLSDAKDNELGTPSRIVIELSDTQPNLFDAHENVRSVRITLPGDSEGFENLDAIKKKLTDQGSGVLDEVLDHPDAHIELTDQKIDKRHISGDPVKPRTHGKVEVKTQGGVLKKIPVLKRVPAKLGLGVEFKNYQGRVVSSETRALTPDQARSLTEDSLAPYLLGNEGNRNRKLAFVKEVFEKGPQKVFLDVLQTGETDSAMLDQQGVPTLPEVGPGDKSKDVAVAQTWLSEANHDAGDIDGIFGPQTQAALQAFQTARGLDATGTMDEATWQALGREVAAARKEEADCNAAKHSPEVPDAPADPTSPDAPPPGAAATAAPPDGIDTLSPSADANDASESAEEEAGFRPFAALRNTGRAIADSVKTRFQARGEKAPPLTAEFAIPASGTYQVGSTGDGVKGVQAHLVDEGYMGSRDNVTGRFDQTTKAAVTQYQADHGLGADGIVGSQTRGHMKALAEANDTMASAADAASEGKVRAKVGKAPLTERYSLPEGGTFRQGQTADGVRGIQAALVENGYLGSAQNVTGTFDQTTDQAVRSLQQDRGLTADGIVGPQTLATLRSSSAEETVSAPPGDPLNPKLGPARAYMLPSSGDFDVGSSGDDVRGIQEFLVAQGHLDSRQNITGLYDQTTARAVKEFQRETDLPKTGAVDDETLSEMGEFSRLGISDPARFRTSGGTDITAVKLTEFNAGTTTDKVLPRDEKLSAFLDGPNAYSAEIEWEGRWANSPTDPVKMKQEVQEYFVLHGGKADLSHLSAEEQTALKNRKMSDDFAGVDIEDLTPARAAWVAKHLAHNAVGFDSEGYNSGASSNGGMEYDATGTDDLLTKYTDGNGSANGTCRTYARMAHYTYEALKSIDAESGEKQLQNTYPVATSGGKHANLSILKVNEDRDVTFANIDPTWGLGDLIFDREKGVDRGQKDRPPRVAYTLRTILSGHEATREQRDSQDNITRKAFPGFPGIGHASIDDMVEKYDAEAPFLQRLFPNYRAGAGDSRISLEEVNAQGGIQNLYLEMQQVPAEARKFLFDRVFDAQVFAHIKNYEEKYVEPETSYSRFFGDDLPIYSQPSVETIDKNAAETRASVLEYF